MEFNIAGIIMAFLFFMIVGFIAALIITEILFLVKLVKKSWSARITSWIIILLIWVVELYLKFFTTTFDRKEDNIIHVSSIL